MYESGRHQGSKFGQQVNFKVVLVYSPSTQQQSHDTYDTTFHIETASPVAWWVILVPTKVNFVRSIHRVNI